jgi:PIN domain nuclease of toxin-antitoxin system
MHLLLDTNVVLGSFDDRQRVPDRVAETIQDVRNPVLVSAASVWEIAIKRFTGKLEIEDGWPRVLNSLGFQPTPVTAEHAVAVQALPWLHRDPFDRLLVAQARVEEATIVTADERIHAYDVPTLWDPRTAHD